MKLPLLASLLAVSATAFAQPALTIYNQNFAVVREIVPLDLRPGVNDVRFSGATGALEPDSVVLRDPSGRVPLQILEQGYRSDAISPGLLLSFYEGKTIDFVTRDQNGTEHKVAGEVIRSGFVPGGSSQSPIIKVDGKLRFSLPGEPIFPALADDNILKPTLSWKLQTNQPARLNAELGYVTGGFTWSASYNLVAPETGDRLDVVGWVTLSNTSGKTFENAAVKLMAGDVAKLEPARMNLGAAGVMDFAMKAEAMAPVATEKAFDEFHLYTLAHPLTIRDGETKQVEFMSGNSVLAPVIYVYDGGSYRSPSRRSSYGNQGNTKVWVMREFKNTEENHLGMPLPAGRLRLYRRDASDGRLEFVGEDRIDHTPKNETVRFYTGDSFDLVGERTMTNSSNNKLLSSARNDRRQQDQSFEIKVRNRKAVPVEIRVVEHLMTGVGINWEITDKSMEYVKANASTVEFRVTVEPDQEQVVTYTVHYTWP